MESIKQMEIIEGAVCALLDSLVRVEKSLGDARSAEQGQLHALEKSLKNYPGPVTEDVWEKVFKANVAEQLFAAKKADGRERYTSRASRDVMVSIIKRATMGLTLAKQDKQFAPSDAASGNLKKYADEVGVKLQKTIDPATGKPRLRSIAAAVPKPKPLPIGTVYWLIGCETDEGIKGSNTVVGADYDLEALRREAKRLSDKFKSYLYVTAPLNMSVLDIAAPEPVRPLAIQNGVVFASTYPPSDAA